MEIMGPVGTRPEGKQEEGRRYGLPKPLIALSEETPAQLSDWGFLLIGVAKRADRKDFARVSMSIGQFGKLRSRRLFARWAEIASAIRSSADKGVYAGDQFVLHLDDRIGSLG